MRIHILDLAPFGHLPQPDVKALGINVSTRSGREQQIIGIGPVRIGHSEDVPDQKLTQAVRNGRLPVGTPRLGGVLDNQVGLFAGIIV